jgi:type I restriction enzyme R subunit
MGAMTPRVDELPRLQTRHAAALRFFARVRDREDLEACVAVLEPEDVRAEFQTAFRRFAESMDRMLPDPRALEYRADLRRLGKIRQAARARFRDPALDLSDCAPKVRRLIEEAIVAEGIQILMQPVSLFSADFETRLAALNGDEAKASEMEHALRAEIHVRLDEDPVYYETLQERLERIIEDRKARRIDAAQQLELLGVVKEDVRGAGEAAAGAGLSETGFAIYHLLGAGAAGLQAGELREEETVYGNEVDEARKELATLIEEAVEPLTRIVDWTRKGDVQREMRLQIKRHLKAARMPKDQAELLAGALVDLIRARLGR